MIRPPAVAGQFYPGTADRVEAELDRLIKPRADLRAATGVVVPHAGWMYSGATAGRVYSAVRIPDHVIMIGPNHHGIGSAYALFDAGKWQTPVGDVLIDEPLAAELLDKCDLLAEDPRAHSAEHSLEVQVPMLRRVNPNVRVVPLLIGGSWPESGGRSRLRELGEAIAATVREYGKPVLLLASSDLNHYEDQETAHIKDKLVLGAIETLDEDALMDCVRDVEVSMCGVAPTYIVIHAAKKLGARHAEVLDYRTSGDVTGDFSSVVGYGGVIITQGNPKGGC
jgi:AmmeMemoRadiSam system protein B